MPAKALALKLYFYSNRNLVGMGLAIAAAALAAAGVVHDYWFLLVAGSYGAGALVTPDSPQMNVTLEREMTDREIIAGLAHIAADAKKLPPAIAADVRVICAALSQAIPIVGQMAHAGSLGYDVRTTATEYLPRTLERYLRMPPAFRATVRVDGKTAEQMLAEQIATLKSGLSEMLASIASADANELAANGRFLREKYAKPAFSAMAS